MNRDNQYSNTSLSSRAANYCGEGSKVKLIDAGDTLVERIKREHEEDRQSRTRESSANSHTHQ
jgi:hypothetical protein